MCLFDFMSDLLDKLIKDRTGFEPCERTQETEDCEQCGCMEHQLFYRKTDYWSADGDYWCLRCAAKEALQRVEEEISRSNKL